MRDRISSGRNGEPRGSRSRPRSAAGSALRSALALILIGSSVCAVTQRASEASRRKPAAPPRPKIEGQGFKYLIDPTDGRQLSDSYHTLKPIRGTHRFAATLGAACFILDRDGRVVEEPSSLQTSQTFVRAEAARQDRELRRHPAFSVSNRFVAHVDARRRATSLPAEEKTKLFDLLKPLIDGRVTDRAEVRNAYDQTAPVYHDVMSGQITAALKLIPDGFRRMQGLPQGPLSVMELGTGNGQTSTAVLAEVLRNGRPKHRSTILGVDLSAQMVAQARKQRYRGVSAHFVNDDALTALKAAPSASQDVVVSVGVLPWHVKPAEMKTLYSELLRVLKPGGYVLHDVLPADLDGVGKLAASSGFAVTHLSEACGFFTPPSVVLRKPAQ